jgi:hypothetical protein
MVTFKSMWNRDPMMLEWMLDFNSEKSSRSINIQFERQPTDFFQVRVVGSREEGEGDVDGVDTNNNTNNRQHQEQQQQYGGSIDRNNNNNTVSTPRHQQVQDWRAMLLQAVNTPSEDDDDEDEDWEPPEWDGGDVDLEMIEFNDFLNAIGEEEDDG